MINWKTLATDFDIIACLAVRAGKKFNLDYHTVMMDLTAVHANGNPLRLKDMEAADITELAHDIYGIARHLDRDTGKLKDCFSPRFSA